MNKNKNIYLVVLISSLFLLFSCASTSGADVSAVEGGEVVSISVSNKGNKSYFSSIDSHIMELIETGSPQGLKQAYSLLHKVTDDEYSEKEKILINVCNELMKILWSSETYSFEVPEVSKSNPYMGAIDSAQRGIYDSSTGNSDFLSIILPSLVLVTSSNRSDYYDNSLAALKECSKIRPESVILNYLLGILYLRTNENEKALNCFITCQKYAPSNYEILLQKSLAYYQLKQYDNCLGILDSLLEKNPQNVDILEIAAKATYDKKDLEKAESYVIRILMLEPENYEYILFRVKLLVDKNDYIRASSLLDVYAKNNESSKDYLLLRAKLQQEWNKNNTAALETVQKAMMLYPEDKEVLLFACQIASLTNSKVSGKSALEIANQLIESDPNNVEVMKITVKEMIKSNQWTNAYEISSKIIKQNVSDNSVIYSHIEICLSLNKNDEALSLSQKMYSQNPNDTDAQQAYIKTLVKTNQKSAALNLINQLLPKSSSKMKSFLYYEKSFFSTSEEEILSDLRSSLTANPRNNDSLYRLYEIYYNKKDWRRAQYYLKQVLSNDPTNEKIIKKVSELDSLLGK